MISVTELDSVATQSRLHSEQGCAKDAHLFSANQAPHIKLCITTEEQNIECSRSCNISHLSCVESGGLASVLEMRKREELRMALILVTSTASPI